MLFKLPLIYIWLVKLAFFIKGKQKDIGLIDNDKANTLYISKRSKMRYIYVANWIADIANKLIKNYLHKKTSIEFNNKINQVCLPINLYNRGDSIKLHRDRNMFNDNIVDYVAVITIEQKGKKSLFTLYKDVLSDILGKNIKILSSNCIPTSTEKGQVIVFYNKNTAHEFECNSDYRMSLTYRTS